MGRGFFVSRIKTLRDTRAELASVKEAIKQVLENGQSMAVDGVAYNRASLGALERRESNLERKIARLSKNRPMASVVRFGAGGYN